MVVKALWECDCLAYMETTFLILSGCVALFSISLYLVFSNIEDNVRFRCGGKAKRKF